MADFSVAAGAGTAAGFFFGILGHEVATARTADALGDKSGRMTRRNTLSAKAHYDPLGTIILPVIFTVASLVTATLRPMFGWGKPHQLNVRAMRNWRRGVWTVSLAGPATTLAFGLIAGFAFRGMGGDCLELVFLHPTAETFLVAFAEACVWLTLIELLPVPGRDGARILGLYLPPRAAMKMEELSDYAVLFLLGIFLILGRVANNLVLPVVESVTGQGCLLP